MIAASLDIGSNSILLLIAELEGGRIKTLYEKFYSPRLGRDLEQSGKLDEQSMAAAERNIADALETCRRWKVEKVLAVATAAVREADNGDEFTSGIKRRLALDIEVIDGIKEAELTFAGAVHRISSQEKVAVLDVGGGSSECILGVGQCPTETMSVPIGAVKLAEQSSKSAGIERDTLSELSQAFSKMARAAEGHRIIGVGGTITTLAAVKLQLTEFEPDRISQVDFSIDELDRMIATFRSSSVEEIRSLPGMDPARADIIEAGATIVRTFVALSRRKNIAVSAYGLRYGVLAKGIIRG